MIQRSAMAVHRLFLREAQSHGMFYTGLLYRQLLTCRISRVHYTLSLSSGQLLAVMRDNTLYMDFVTGAHKAHWLRDDRAGAQHNRIGYAPRQLVAYQLILNVRIRLNRLAHCITSHTRRA